MNWTRLSNEFETEFLVFKTEEETNRIIKKEDDLKFKVNNIKITLQFFEKWKEKNNTGEDLKTKITDERIRL